MCMNATVETVVKDFVSKGFMFTAFDVTKFIRMSGQNIKHDSVNNDVKSMFRNGEMPDYEKDTKDIGVSVAPFVYYHQHSDINDYQADWITNNPTQSGMLNNAPAASASGISQPTASSYGAAPITSVGTVKAYNVSSVKTSLPKGVHGTDKEGRLYIAPVVTQQAGLAPKQTVWVVGDGLKLVVTTSSNACGAWPYQVNSDGRIRICRSILSKIPKGNGYKVSASTGNIEVVPA